MVLLSDPAVEAIPVRECGEPLVDLRTVAALRVDDRLAGEEGLHARLRIGVVDRLVTAQTLLPVELRLLVVEGHRPGRTPHACGAAVDVSLCTVDADEVDLGTAVHDASTSLSRTDDPAVTGEARSNRDFLASALRGAGLVNYPRAWWHWSYGDRYWAYVTGSAQAFYGPVPADVCPNG
ncbi:M15 family metallopeptidase [Lentzea sp. NPDC060358]|uniref:M15 family metallopeptidase n=1 Tax=Lentzea sp. NPDC060358 TaxID=3347103 RepID=UPI00365B5697